MSTFALIVCNRSFFPDHVVATARQELIEALARQGHDSIVLSPEDSKGGGVETPNDARRCADLFRRHQDRIDGLILCMPNFGDELSVATAIRQSSLDVPILVQACPDDLQSMDLEHRRDAFCGKISVCNNLRQCGIPFSLTKDHVCDISGDRFAQDLKRFASLCRVVKGLRQAKIAAIGARPDAFHTVRYSEKLLQRSGIDVSVVDFSMILHAARQLSDEKVIDKAIDRIRRYGQIDSKASPHMLEKVARLSLALEAYVRDEGCQASAVQCWDAVQKNYGVAACLPMSLMGQDGKPSACEMDVMGAVSMLALQLAADSPPMLQDWNNNYGDEEDHCVNVHCANFPAATLAGQADIGFLDVLATTLGKENCFGACKGRVQPGPMTFFRLSTDDTQGIIRGYVGQGEFTDDPLSTFGGVTVCHIRNLQGLLSMLCEEGFEHHVAMVHGHCADLLQEAAQKYLGWSVTRHR